MEKTTRKEYLEEMVVAKKTYLFKSFMTSGGCYLITLKNVKTGVRVQMRFNDNYYNDGDVVDFVYCLMMDAWCYEESKDLEDFVRSLGYDSIYDTRAIKAYNSCKKQYERFNKIFSVEERKKVKRILENY